MTPNEVEELFGKTKTLTLSKTSEDDPDQSEEEKAKRKDQLGPVLDTVTRLWTSGSEELDIIAQKVGDGSRDTQWRIPLGESQILDFFLNIISTEGLRLPLIIHTLRIIGNTSADTDENRARVVSSGAIPHIVHLLNNDSLLPIVIPVLYNVSVDYEPAQKAAYEAGLNPELISLVSGERLEAAEDFLGYAVKLLGLVASQDPEPNRVDPTTPFILLSLPSRLSDAPDLEDLLGLTSVSLTYLSHEQFQGSFLATPGALDLFLGTFERVSSELDEAFSSGAAPDGEVGEQVGKIRSVFTQTLADLSAHPNFTNACPLDGPTALRLRSWLSPSAHGNKKKKQKQLLQSAACLALGNLARSDESCIAFVSAPLRLHEALAGIVSGDRDDDDAAATPDAQLLHAALGFLKNLAIPSVNKPVIGEHLLLGGKEDGEAEEATTPPLARIWRLDVQPQVQFDAVSLARLLLVGCPANVQLMLSSSSSNNPNASSGKEQQQQQSLFRTLLETGARADQDPTKLEAARAALAVCRVLHQQLSGDDDASRQQLSSLEAFFDAYADLLPAALLLLARQPKFPSLRSELWFVLALVARSSSSSSAAAGAGARAVGRVCFGVFKGVEGDDEEQQRGEEGGDTSAGSPGAGSKKELLEALIGVVIGEEQEKEEAGEERDGGQKEDAVVADLASQLGQMEPRQAPLAAATTASASTARVDRENALVLVHELLRHVPSSEAEAGSDDVVDQQVVGSLRRALERGGQLVAADKSG